MPYTTSNVEIIQEFINETKKRISKIDYVIPQSSLDVRFSAAQEIPIGDMSCDDVMDFMRVKQRTSFIRKNLSIR